MKKVSFDTCCNFKGCRSKLHQQVIEIKGLGRARWHLFEIMWGFEQMCFVWVWGSTKSWPNIANVSDLGRQSKNSCYIWSGSAGGVLGKRNRRCYWDRIFKSWFLIAKLFIVAFFNKCSRAISFRFSTPLQGGRRIQMRLAARAPPPPLLAFEVWCIRWQFRTRKAAIVVLAAVHFC